MGRIVGANVLVWTNNSDNGTVKSKFCATQVEMWLDGFLSSDDNDTMSPRS